MDSSGEHSYSIGAVERDTGIRRDTLRVWERRYAFPLPERDARGERVYSEEQMRRLRLICKLMDQGHRPGAVVPLNEAGLNALLEPQPGQRIPAEPPDAVRRLLDAVTRHDAARLQELLERDAAINGLRASIVGTIAPLVQEVGELWASGRMAIYEEHFLTRQLGHFLETSMGRMGRPATRAETLLATLPGEQHGLGLLMADVSE